MKYQISLNNGQIINLSDVNLNTDAFTNTLNEQSVIFVNLGGAIVNKHLISMILPVAAEELNE